MVPEAEDIPIVPGVRLFRSIESVTQVGVREATS
jgi:hypothetical protein